jgi:hypothetical protein
VAEPKTVREPKTKAPRKPAAQRALRNMSPRSRNASWRGAAPVHRPRLQQRDDARDRQGDRARLPSIYYQFRDKRELYLKGGAQVVINGNEGPRRALTADAPPVVRVFNFWVAVAEVSLKQPHLNKFIMRLLLEEDREGLHLINESAMQDIFERFISTLEEATARPATMRDLVAAYSLCLCMCHSPPGRSYRAGAQWHRGLPEALSPATLLKPSILK